MPSRLLLPSPRRLFRPASVPPILGALPLLLATPGLTATAAAAASSHGGDRRAAAAHPASGFEPERWKALRWREVGPYRGGGPAAGAGGAGAPPPPHLRAGP